MKTAPSEDPQGAAEETVEVDNDEKELVGYLDAPNKDTNTPPPPGTQYWQYLSCLWPNLTKL